MKNHRCARCGSQADWILRNGQGLCDRHWAQFRCVIVWRNGWIAWIGDQDPSVIFP